MNPNDDLKDSISDLRMDFVGNRKNQQLIRLKYPKFKFSIFHKFYEIINLE